ncbi:hypothetical protein M408DRAFT_313205, partial [Serendipita vermifera MAFF 305830]
MPPKSKSIFRQPGAKNFQLVHRSQRDPLIHDPDASEHVLKEYERKNAKGKVSSLGDEAAATDSSRAPGEAALYGIYFDDREYDYTQHLRQVGVEESGVDAILIEAPSRHPHKSNKARDFDLIPKEALPSQQEIPRTYDSGQAIESSIAGFQPDMDPHLRQTLEALDDDAFVDPAVDDDLFADLLADGELEEGEELNFEFHEDGIQEEAKENDETDDWQSRFAKFKLEQKKRVNAGSEMDGVSEGGDTLGRLPSLSVAGAKKRRRKGTSDASGYSMSSSSMFRNEGLTRLDEQFERFEEEYASDNDDDMEDDADSHSTTSAPELIATRDDFDAVMDEFLAQEQVGKKLQQKIGDTPMDRLNTVRRALVESTSEKEERERREALLDRLDEGETPIPMPVDVDEKKERWDCETILTTYSNLENHPRLLRLTQPRRTQKIQLDPRTGLPSVAEIEPVDLQEISESEDSDGDLGGTSTITRPKNETSEEKRARKQAVKKERQERRKEKKGTKNLFSTERKQQNKTLATKEKAGVRKL